MKKLILSLALIAFAIVCSTESFALITPQSSQTAYQQAGQHQQMFAQDEGDTPKKGKKAKKVKSDSSKPVKKGAKKAKKDED